MNTTDAFRNFNAFQGNSPFARSTSLPQGFQNSQAHPSASNADLDMVSLGSPSEESFRPVNRQQLLALFRPEGTTGSPSLEQPSGPALPQAPPLTSEAIRLAPTMISNQAWRLLGGLSGPENFGDSGSGGVWTSRDLLTKPNTGPVDPSITAF